MKIIMPFADIYKFYLFHYWRFGKIININAVKLINKGKLL